MTDFLLELRSEEIPARMQDKAREDLARLFAAELARAGLAAAAGVETYATPRRLALIARDLPAETAAVSEELKGPRTSAPPQALDGFLRKTGLTQNALVERDGVYYAVIDKPGRATDAVLAEAIPAIVRAFPWPKSMRWGDASASTESLRWVRPLHGIVALLGSEVVPCEIAGIVSGRSTVGHRFHSAGTIEILSPADYADQLRAAHVVLDQDERRSLIRTRAAALAADAGLVLVEDEGLVDENAGLTEWPVPLLGRFDDAFLDVPSEVIQLTARVNQKYFVCRDAAGRLANAFVCTANIDASDGGAKIVEGNRKVLAARLSDARFFYETDLKVPLEEQAKKLDKIVFHEKLGTVADKVDRVAKLARWLVEQGIVGAAPSNHPGEGRGPVGDDQLAETSPSSQPPSQLGPGLRRGGEAERGVLAAQAERAARLCKADLVTGMVGEFPELQGLIGGYYARAQGEDDVVADAIRDHYKPVGQGDDVPTAPVTVAVSLADKLDTLVGFYLEGLYPSGSKDPFALRRAAIGVATTIIERVLRLPLGAAVIYHASRYTMRQQDWPSAIEYQARNSLIDGMVATGVVNDDTIAAVKSKLTQEAGDTWSMDFRRAAVKNIRASKALLDFFADRLKVQQREAGVRHDLIDAVFALGGEDDLVRLLARVRALQAFVGTPDGTNLLAGYKRAANILKKEGYTPPRAPAHAGAQGQAASDNPGLLPAQEHGARDGALPYTPESAEAALFAALDSAEPAATAAIAAEDFEGAMVALASLRAPIDAFFETVTVNDPDQDKRAARLHLLARVRTAVHSVADFSKIEG
ncbi:glycine--tRNA ligase subunit beta [uncultured Sphingomonas sp.]|uniref:glycine--tRNA ligase subunit beta n=1 Tax=uncultured Sphingomonas sp. TaxID=158754 RepID=UPI0035CB5A9C